MKINNATIKTILLILMLFIVIITLACFFYVFITSYLVIKDPYFANGSIKSDLIWDKIYCSKHDCTLQYITDKAKKFVDAGWIVIIGFVGSIWTWTANYLGKISGIEKGKMIQRIEDLENQNLENIVDNNINKCEKCNRDL